MRAMIISVVIPSFYPATIYGGTIYSSLNHARILVSLGHKVYVSTTNTNMKSRLDVPTGRFIEIEKNLFVKYYNETIIDKLSLPLIFNIWKDIRKADVVHIQAIFNTPIPIALFYSKIFNKKVLLSPHGVLGNWVMSNGGKFKKIWLNLFIRPFSSSIFWHATSDQEKQEILNHFPNASVYVFGNALSLEEYKDSNQLSKNEFLKKFANREGEVGAILISMGRLQKKKGFDILIKTFKQVCAKYPSGFLFIAGEDQGEKFNLLKLIKDFDLVDKVFLVGDLQGQDKVDFLANADLFILPSHNENFGIVYAEALAAGTPVVASKETPWAEVEKNNCGKWVSNSVKDIEFAILEMLKVSEVNIRGNAREFANKFSFQNVGLEFNKVLNEIGKKNA